LTPISGSLASILRRCDEIRSWREANVAIADAWDDAEAEDYERARQADKLRREEERRAGAPAILLAAGVGDRDVQRWREAKLDTQARQAVKRWLSSDRLVLALIGGPGAGKTIASCDALVASKPPVRFVTAGEMARLPPWDGSLFAPRMLVVDDLNASAAETAAGEKFLGALEELLCDRQRMNRRTVLSSNVTPDAFLDRYAKEGTRIRSRLGDERGGGMMARCGDNDLRKARTA